MRFPRLPILLASLALAGCLERVETVTVHADGSLEVEHRITGDGDDLDHGAARYPTRAPWAATRTTRKKEDGQIEHVLTARARFGAASDVPRHFGAAGDPLAERDLRFDTEVTIRRDGRRTHYRFVRTYHPRPWADYAHFWRRSFPKPVQEMIDDPDSIRHRSEEERRQLIEAILDYQCRLLRHWAARAAEAVAPGHPERPEVLLAVRDVVDGYRRSRLGAASVAAVLARPVEEIESFAQDFEREVNRRILAVVVGRLALDPAGAARFEAEMAAARHEFDVTKDLEDENFVVRVRLPGRPTGDNGDARELGFVVWRFDDEDLRDRAHVLVATSVVEE